MGALRGSTRALALLKTAVLARFLTPGQFGVYGVGMLALGFLEILTETGINIFLIQEKDRFKKYLNSAWVVSIIRGFFIALAIIMATPMVLEFFKLPQALLILRLIALVAFVRGFINPGVVIFQKNLRFKQEFIYRTGLFIVDTTAAVFLGIATRSELSLVWGMLAAALLEVVTSFIIFKPRPKLILEIEKFKQVVSRGKWITLAGVFNYLFQHLDDIVVGKLLGVGSLGVYQQAYRISTLPISEVQEIFNKVTFPVYVGVSGQKEVLRKAFLKTTLTIALLVIPAGIIFLVFAKSIVALVLGAGWLEAVYPLKVLAIFAIFKAISNSAFPIFLGVKKQEIISLVTLASIIGLAVTIVPLTFSYGLVGAGMSTIIGSLVGLPFIVYYLIKILK